ncbi:hypothetical protein [Pengzhenrongella frigida]|uniref:Uncharacterized protein n=1 Tax=Pengzhenrongella frigida TaxID=1259133 RepID=A0A4Q5MYS5_9MICO|nr:hypothetical protein [Cellulomonas sp. HLT2-17]RYV50083.1 hypothetical protein EUA98_15285 [Cellulomonas sp. HLT2-17]
MSESVDRVVDAAIASASVDLEAPAGARVRFEPDALESVRALGGDEPTRARVLAVLRQRLSTAILSMEPVDAEPDWHDAQAAQGLLSWVEGASDGSGRG